MNTLCKTLATATATGSGRGGTATVQDGALTLSLSTPKPLWGPGGDDTNPEQLFAAVMRPASSARCASLPDVRS